jgi:hypothetical protein
MSFTQSTGGKPVNLILFRPDRIDYPQDVHSARLLQKKDML